MKYVWLLSLFFLFANSCGTQTNVQERFEQSLAGASSVNFQAAPNNPNQFSFALVGDTHIGNANVDRLGRIIEAAKAQGDEFLVLAGDIADKGTRSDYQAVLQMIDNHNWTGKVIAASGNHDIFDDGWTNYLEAFGSSTYTIAFGNTRFVVIDTSDGTVGRSQAQWLEARLGEGSFTHNFVISHYMPLVPSIRTYLKLSDREEAHRMMSLMKQYSVDGWLGGHYHSFINANIAGVQYVVAGGGGGRRMEPVKDFFFVQVIINHEDVNYRMVKVD